MKPGTGITTTFRVTNNVLEKTPDKGYFIGWNTSVEITFYLNTIYPDCQEMDI